MNEDDNLNRLIDIISRLEISARRRDNDLNNAWELIERLQYERRQPPRAAVLVTRTQTKRDTRIEDRSIDLVSGVDIQIGDTVAILNPRLEQSHKGRVIGKTRDNLIQIEGRFRIEERTIVKVIRRIPDSITVLTCTLV